MRCIMFPLFVCVLAVNALLPQKAGGSQERESLTFLLGQEVKQFLLENRIRAEDRHIVSKITVSLLNDPPLKPIEEIMEVGQRIATPLADDDGYRTYKEILKDERVQGVLNGMRTRIRPFPVLTEHQARDLKRLLDLRAAFNRSNVSSKAASRLYELLIMQIQTTTGT